MNCIQNCFFVLLIIKTINGCEDEKRLQEKLISGYNRLVRPVEKNIDTLDLKLGIKLIQILDIDEKNQIMITKVWVKHIWKDINLKWNPVEYSNLTKISIPSTSIWIPDVILFNSADGKYEISLMTRAQVDYDGNVVWEPPAIFKSYCTIDVEFFPFDHQLCAMKFGSWTYDGHQVDLLHISQKKDNDPKKLETEIPIGIDLIDFHQNHEWDIMSVPAKRGILKNLGSDEFYPEITFNISIRRKSLFYTCNLIIPCICLTFLTVLTFYLPSESGEKISLCVSILLSLTVFISLPNDLMPPTSLVVPLIGKYLIFIIIVVTLSIACTIVVLNVHFRALSTHIIPKWARRLFLNVLPKFLLMKRPKLISQFSTRVLAEDFSAAARNKNRQKCLEEIKFGSFNSTCRIISNQQDVYNCDLMRDRRLLAKNKDSKINDKVMFRPSENIRKRAEALIFISNVKESVKYEQKEKKIQQEWRLIALVIDRILLATFSTACLAGTAAIILQAPSFYDNKNAIDQIISKIF